MSLFLQNAFCGLVSSGLHRPNCSFAPARGAMVKPPYKGLYMDHV